MLIKKYSCENVKLRHFGKRRGILAESPHLTKIAVSVISDIIYRPY